MAPAPTKPKSNPGGSIEAMAGDWLTVHIRRDLAEKMLSGYRAWLIGGDE